MPIDEEISRAEKITKIVVTLGVPTIIALGLVWLLASRVDASINSIKSDIMQHMSDTRSLTEKQKEGNTVLRQICVNLAISSGTNPSKCIE